MTDIDDALHGALELAPIAGVSLELYTDVIRRAAIANHDPSIFSAMAALYGIDAPSWQLAHEGWSRRISDELAVAELFAVLYHG